MVHVLPDSDFAYPFLDTPARAITSHRGFPVFPAQGWWVVGRRMMYECMYACASVCLCACIFVTFGLRYKSEEALVLGLPFSYLLVHVLLYGSLARKDLLRPRIHTGGKCLLCTKQDVR